MKKLHAADPERMFAVDKNKGNGPSAGRTKNVTPVPKKSLSERANLVRPEEETGENEE